MMMGILAGVYLFIAYVLGGIPFGLVIARGLNLGDLRKLGSGNIGATNVLRTGNRLAAVATLACDMGKGAVAIGLGVWLGAPDWLMGAGVLCVVFGHCFSPFLRFSGGKGVATFLGAMLVLSFGVAVLVCLCWLVVAFLWRISSLAALVATAGGAVILLVFGGVDMAVGVGLCAALIWWQHRGNILRLLQGQEPRIGG